MRVSTRGASARPPAPPQREEADARTRGEPEQPKPQEATAEEPERPGPPGAPEVKGPTSGRVRRAQRRRQTQRKPRRPARRRRPTRARRRGPGAASAGRGEGGALEPAPEPAVTDEATASAPTDASDSTAPATAPRSAGTRENAASTGTGAAPGPGPEPGPTGAGAGAGAAAAADGSAGGPRDAEPGSAAYAFDLLHARQARALTRQAYLLCGRQRRAERAVAYAFHRAWERWPEVAVDQDPAGWVRAAAYEYALSPWHRLRPRRRLRGQTGEPGLLGALLGLPPSYRAALLLHHGLGLSVEDTAAETEASSAATAGRLEHAREALAARLPEMRETPPQRHGALLGARLRELAAGYAVGLPYAPDVRRGSERLTRRWIGAAAGLTATVTAATLFTLATESGRPTAPTTGERKPVPATAPEAEAEGEAEGEAEPGPSPSRRPDPWGTFGDRPGPGYTPRLPPAGDDRL